MCVWITNGHAEHGSKDGVEMVFWMFFGGDFWMVLRRFRDDFRGGLHVEQWWVIRRISGRFHEWLAGCKIRKERIAKLTNLMTKINNKINKKQ